MLVASVTVHAQLIERVLARVDGSIIMLSDVRAAIALGLVDVPAGAAAETAALEQLIDRQVALREVARFTAIEPDAAAIDRQAAAMKARAGANLQSLMQATGLDEARIRDLARDTLRLQSYVRQRFGAAATLGDADVRQWTSDARTRASIARP